MASCPNPRYFKDGAGLRPNWRFALRWPRTYLWHQAVHFLPWSLAKWLRRPLGRFPRQRSKSLWCRLGLHRWCLGVDTAAPTSPTIVALCSECGLMEVVREGTQQP